MDQMCDLSLELWRAQEFEVATQMAKRASLHFPDASLPFSYQGMSLKELKQWPEAAYAFEQALKRNTDYPWDLINLGTCYIELNKLDMAIDMLERACNALPMDQTAHTEMARAYMLAGRCPEAIAFIDETLPRMHLDALVQYREECARAGN